MPSVFISYAHADHGTVSNIINALQNANIPVWIDHQKLRPGTSNWEHAIRTAIADAPAFILVASPNTVRSQYVPDEISIAQLRTPPIPIIPVWIDGKNYIEAVPMGMGRVQGLDLRDGEFEANIQALMGTLREIMNAEEQSSNQYVLTTPAADAVPADFTPHNPYQGLEAFTEKTSRYYFGRTALVNKLANRLHEDRFLAVVGASGSGKSSVVMAGLLPKLRYEHPDWVILPPMKPGAQPVEELSIVLASQRQAAITNVRPDLESADTRGLLLQAKLIGRECRVVLIVDQFEELFTLTTDAAVRERFINLLTAAATAPDSNLTVILTLRADFSDRPLAYPELGHLINEHSEAVLPLSLVELTEVVLGPAALDDVRMSFEGDLAARLVYTVREQPGGLPLLQFALDQLFQRREGQRLTLKAYEQIGELKGALAKHAEATYAALPTESHRQLARGLFLRLISPGATEQESTRRRVMQRELTPADPTRQWVMETVIRQFIKARLLTTGEIAGEPTLEVSHEALIREWDVLRTWLDQFRSEVRLQQSISQDAADWLRNGKRPDDLYLGEKLREAEAWARGGAYAVSAEEAAFIEAGGYRQRELREDDERRIKALEQAETRAKRTRERLLITTAFAAVMITIAIVAAYIGLQGQQTAAAREDQANTQVAIALETLTPIPATLTQVAEQANAQVANAQSTVVQVGTSVSNTLTPIPATLAKVADDIRNAEAEIESLRLAVLAKDILNNPFGDIETPILLGIRALKTAYSVPADAALVVAIGRLDVRTLIGHKGGITSVAFSPNGRFIATGSVDNTAKLWDAATGKELHTFSGHTSTLISLAFSPDGHYLVTASNDETVRLWDIDTGIEIRIFYHSINGIRPSTVAFSPDGHSILAIGDYRMHQWNIATGKESIFFDNLSDVLAFTPDGHYILTSSWDNTATLWDAINGKEVYTFVGHTQSITCAKFSPDGRYALTGAYDGTAKLWDTATGKEIYSFDVDGYDVSSLAFSSDAHYGITGTFGGAKLWDITTGKFVRAFNGHEDTVTSVAVSPKGDYILTGSGDSTAKLWPITENKEQRTFGGHTEAVLSVAVSSDGRYVVTGSADNTAKLWDASSEKELHSFSGHNDAVTDVAFSPDGRYVLTGSWDKTAKLWDVATGKELRTFIGHEAIVSSVAFSPDGRYVLTGSWDETAKLWDAATGKELRTFIGHSMYIKSVAFSPDGRYALTGAGYDMGPRDFTARLWDIATGKQLRTFIGHKSTIWSVAFSPNGRYVLTGAEDNTAKLWDVSTGILLHTFSGHTDTIRGVVFSPDGRYALTGAVDGTARLWDIATGNTLRTFSYTWGISSVAFSPDGHFVFTGTGKNTAKLWETNYHDFLSYACTQVTRDFTRYERQDYHILDNEPTCPQFATVDNPMNTLMPPTTTAMAATMVSPIWTPIASPTITYTPSATFTMTYTPTATFTSTATVTFTDLPLLFFASPTFPPTKTPKP
ncbi:MAG: TIR domain-containing protein [Anaerolineae bacterium]|nr:TIR domain-containing protein [Anaerolineae bacterium]